MPGFPPSDIRPVLVLAVADGGVIGHEGGLPWRLPADMAHFKRVTTGHHLVMGRRTWESLGGPLPGRTSIVLTRRPGYDPEGALVARDLDAALALAAQRGDLEPRVVGGADVFREALTRAARVILTRIEAEVPGDTFFPEADELADDPLWREVSRRVREPDADNPHRMVFLVYERRPGP